MRKRILMAAILLPMALALAGCTDGNANTANWDYPAVYGAHFYEPLKSGRNDVNIVSYSMLGYHDSVVIKIVTEDDVYLVSPTQALLFHETCPHCGTTYKSAATADS
jgi:hypothetical protein